MYCPRCGSLNQEEARHCQGCGQILNREYPVPERREVPNYIVPSVLVTFFCCLPLGIVALVYSLQVNAKLQVGDYAEAVSYSDKAKTWCWVSFGLGLLTAFISVIAAMSSAA